MIEVKLVNYTNNPELTIAIAAKTCFHNLNYEDIQTQLGRKEVERIIRNLIQKNHQSPLEHANFTFAISGVSRIFTHQLVRHRIASYSQLSQQRTDSSQLEFTTPPEIQKYPGLKEEYEDMMKQCQQLYKHFVRRGIPRNSARYILPSAFNTRIVTTMNARSLLNLLAQRECEVEEWEFRQVASLMHGALMKVAPGIFQFAGPPCQTRGYCPEEEKGIYCARFGRVTTLKETHPEEIKLQLV